MQGTCPERACLERAEGASNSLLLVAISLEVGVGRDDDERAVEHLHQLHRDAAKDVGDHVVVRGVPDEHDVGVVLFGELGDGFDR